MTLVANFEDSLSTFEIITLVGSSVMTLVGILYICLKIFCCEKEGDIIDEANKSDDSDWLFHERYIFDMKANKWEKIIF